uniref:Uncharacterized protein n=1 Tax=Caudovirales sp. ctTqA28 TaxID=2826775 RepID=A0A8S5MDW6_9CAUD|nr:MAG TPA: hypothetical protein [Caudovirales sp. ctTqA28]
MVIGLRQTGHQQPQETHLHLLHSCLLIRMVTWQQMVAQSS